MRLERLVEPHSSLDLCGRKDPTVREKVFHFGAFMKYLMRLAGHHDHGVLKNRKRHEITVRIAQWLHREADDEIKIARLQRRAENVDLTDNGFELDIFCFSQECARDCGKKV